MRSPSSSTSPAAIRPGGSSRPITAAPVSDLPAPDSPTTPSTSPSPIWNETPLTATSVPRRAANSTRRFLTSRVGVLRPAALVLAISAASGSARRAASRREVDREHQQHQGDARKDRHPPL